MRGVDGALELSVQAPLSAGEYTIVRRCYVLMRRREHGWVYGKPRGRGYEQHDVVVIRQLLFPPLERVCRHCCGDNGAGWDI